MYKVKIIGAGSIGNHMAQAARRMGWSVDIVDNDPKALQRTKEDIYPKRYGAWDDSIGLYESGKEPKGGYDVVCVCTPPDWHLPVATKILKEEAPKVFQIEKPLCSPTLEGLPEFLEETHKHSETSIVVGFDHVVAENTKKAEELARASSLGKLLSLDCEFRSNWDNILKAHPWLSGPKDTYLGFWKRGGGAGGEHSHGLNLWQHFAHVLGAGKVKEVGAIFDYVGPDGASYDQSCFLNLVTEKGLMGRVAQDVFTQPKKKFLTLQFEKGSIGWFNDVTKTSDVVTLNDTKNEQKFEIQKTRPDEFFHEMTHINDILEGNIKASDSPIRLERALDTMYVLAAAHKAYREKRIVTVEYQY